MKERFNNTKKRFVKKIIVKNKPIIIGLLFIIILGVVVVPNIFASLQPVRSIEILSGTPSYSSKEEGAWKVTNSAEFISSDTALVTMNLDTIAKGSSNYKDVVFLIDTSESMLDAKLSALKSGVVASIENILKDENNKVGIISFNSSSTLLSNLSNNKSDLIDKVNSLTKGTGTSYYQALINLDNILKNYENDENRELKVIFITDGMPSKDSPNEVGEYKYLKDKYSFLEIDAVQYEAGEEVFESLKNISDRQYILSSGDLEKKLISISTSATSYEEFTIKEYLNNDNFMVESIDDIKVDTGSVILNNNVVIWNLNNISSGSKAKMTLKAKLKNISNGIYKLNDEISVRYKLAGSQSRFRSVGSTPVLSNSYKVKYDGNKPSDCTISGVPDEATHKVFETVGISSAPKCSGYQFKGWDIVTDKVTKVNDDYFLMPEADVTLKANWSKLNIRKSTDGKLKESLTLYKQVEEDVSESSRYAKKYTGDTSTFNGDKNVYYYYGAAANNNVVFANYCWKIVRTTDTGGVKLLYNGVPSNGTCNNTGDASALTASQMGISSNKVRFNSYANSPADVGYMYNTEYFSARFVDFSSIRIITSAIDSNFSYYGDSYTWDGSKYILNNPVKRSSVYYKNAVGKYAFWNGNTDSSTTLYYILKADNSGNLYYITLSKGMGITDSGYEETITFSDTIINNGDGTYTLSNPVIIEKKNWRENYQEYKNYYTCGSNELTCSNSKMKLIFDTNTIDIYLFSLNDLYKYGNSFTYNNGKYTLVDTIENYPDDNHHYTCKNDSGECTTLYYINNRAYSYFKGILLNEGKGIDDVLNEMLYNDDVNNKNSTIKTAIDTWYSNYMTEYTSFLEDTIWCNDRSIDDKGGWEPDGGSLSEYDYLMFYTENNLNNLSCINKNDRFTVSSTNGNGDLTYPVGLITREEIYLAYNQKNSPLSFGASAWGMSPYSFDGTFARAVLTYESSKTGFASNDVNSTNYYVRPSLSLRAGVEYSNGDGSSDHPYVIVTD